ncbi:hypothetical protein WOC76_10040 [Methylocystis sp. IM3]|uniref:hypothetical protein n=1 Tax=unclassified Methylocystis TaxID=2625913 RepID=UPI0030F79273
MLGKTLFASLAVCAATAAQAQIRAEHPRFCVMSVGPTQMMFSAFQENKTDEIFCQRVPELGKTMIILDARSNELRDMNIEVRVLRNIDQKDWRDDLEATTVTALPPKKYLQDRGTTSFTYDFGKEGEYIALVRATSDDGAKEYVGQYYFAVGESYEQAMATGALAAAMGFGGLVMWRRSQSAKTAKTATQGKPASSAARQSP